MDPPGDLKSTNVHAVQEKAGGLTTTSSCIFLSEEFLSSYQKKSWLVTGRAGRVLRYSRVHMRLAGQSCSIRLAGTRVPASPFRGVPGS